MTQIDFSTPILVLFLLWLAVGVIMLLTAEVEIEKGAPLSFVVKSMLLFVLVGPYLLIKGLLGPK